MKPKAFVFAGFALASAVVASAMDAVTVSVAPLTSRSERWMNSFYQSSESAGLVRHVYALSRDGYFERDGAVATSIGFFSQIFAANPGQVDSWFAQFRELPAAHQRLMAAALWYAGNPKGDRLLSRLSAKSSQSDEIAQLVARGTAGVAETPVVSEQSMNLQWGAFLATGADQHVTSILAAIGRGEVGDAARVSLAFNAAQHDRVLQVVRAELDRQPNEVRSVLRAVINDAEKPAAAPSS